MLYDFGDETTYRTQPAFVLKRSAQGYLYFSDRWNGSNYFQSSYVVLPIEFKGAVPVLNDYAALTLDSDTESILFAK
ncbi:hypothetical protein D3C75_1060220 [compost metagenome]